MSVEEWKVERVERWSWEEEGKDGVDCSHVVNRDGSRQKERLEVHYATAGTITTNVIEFDICSK